MSLLYTWWLFFGVLLLGIWLIRLAGMTFCDRRRLFLASSDCPHCHPEQAEMLSAPAYPRIARVSLGDSPQAAETAMADGDWPLVSIIVPAKDEEANIRSCVESLLDQDYPHFELIVVNDRSSDETAAIVESIRLHHARAVRRKLVHVHSLPAGWFGKPHAMKVGVESARGSLLCFIDADCRQTSPCTLWAAVARVQTQYRSIENRRRQVVQQSSPP